MSSGATSHIVTLKDYMSAFQRLTDRFGDMPIASVKISGLRTKSFGVTETRVVQVDMVSRDSTVKVYTAASDMLHKKFIVRYEILFSEGAQQNHTHQPQEWPRPAVRRRMAEAQRRRALWRRRPTMRPPPEQSGTL